MQRSEHLVATPLAFSCPAGGLDHGHQSTAGLGAHAGPPVVNYIVRAECGMHHSVYSFPPAELAAAGLPQPPADVLPPATRSCQRCPRSRAARLRRTP